MKIRFLTLLLSGVLTFSASAHASGSHSKDGHQKEKKCNKEDKTSDENRWDDSDSSCDSKKNSHDESADNDHHKFAHPFFAHMGLPDKAGEINVRLNSISQRSEEEGGNNSDHGIHIEAGIAENWGVHYRNDGFKNKTESEIMLQRTVFTDAAKTGGIAVFGQYSMYKDDNEEEEEGVAQKKEKNALDAFGISGSKTLSFAALNANIHYNTTRKMYEWEGSSVFKANDWIFPILELRGEVKDSNHEVYALPGVKFKILPSAYLGLGFQFPISSNKEYDSQALLQLDLSF